MHDRNLPSSGPRGIESSPGKSERFSVRVRNAGKSYGSLTTFSGVNMTVPEGTIYGLLGPSGCGKTTLLRCILGRLSLDEGSVLVFGHCPGSVESGVPGPNVGYMPQEACVHSTLTIAEFWTYYGTILGLSKDKIKLSTRYLINLLNLPPANTINCNLSLGELRRVAFAAALIHEPKLLILDEPTVGIDIITKHRCTSPFFKGNITLEKNMWDHLLKLAKEKRISIILTTHYIEEARAAHKVGLMHGGTLTVEDETENLLQKLDCRNLEDVFLKICGNFSAFKSIENNKNEIKNSSNCCIQIDNTKTDKFNVVKNELSRLKFKYFYVRSFILRAIFLKSFLNFIRFPGAALFAAYLPSAYFFICVYALGLSLNLQPVGVVNEDSGELSRQFLSIFDAHAVELKMLDRTNASLALADGNVRGVITIPKNFSELLARNLLKFPLSSRDAVNSSTIRLKVDNVELNIGLMVRIHAFLAYQKFLYSAYNISGLNPGAARPLLEISEETLNYLSSVDRVPLKIGVSVVLCYFVPAFVCGLNLFMDKIRGHLEMGHTLGISPMEVMLGLLGFSVALSAIQIAFLEAVGYLMFLDHLGLGSLLLIYCVLFFHALSGTTFGAFLSLTSNDTIFVFLVAANVIVVAGAIIGSFWPLQAMPYFVQCIMKALPQALPFRTVSAIFYQKSFYLSEVLYALVITLSWTVIFLFGSLILLIKK